MKNRSKALFLSALVLPGLGQVILKRYKRGILIILLVLLGLFRFMSIAMQQANEAVARLMTQGGSLDMRSISEAANQSAATASYDFYLWLILIGWLVSLLDILLSKSS